MSGENGHKQRSYFGERVRELRLSRSMNKSELASIMSAHSGKNLVAAHITQMEDRTRSPRAKTMDILAKIFNVSPSYFIDDGYKPSNQQLHPLEADILNLIEAYRNKDLDAAIKLLSPLKDDKPLFDIQGDKELQIVYYYIIGNKRTVLNIFLMEDNS